MTKPEKEHIESLPTLGYWSALGGVEVKRIEYGIEDYIVCVIGAWTGVHTYHRLRVKYTHSKDARAYVDYEGTKLYLDQCLRTGI